MLGNLVNATCIILGSLLGLLAHRGLKDNYKTVVMQAIGLAVLFIGAVTAIGGLLKPESEAILFIISLVIGGATGELLGLENKLEGLGRLIQSKMSRGQAANEGNIARGFVTASLIFCVGTMAIIGSLESGLKGNHNMLFAKSVLDGVTAMILSSTMGIGVIFSAAMVFLYQGAIVLFATALEPFLRGKKIVLFGSYGWGGSYMADWEQRVRAAGADLIAPGLLVLGAPDESVIEDCRALGAALAKA